jgi:hypothetical protein
MARPFICTFAPSERRIRDEVISQKRNAMTQQVLMRRANGQFLGTVIVEPADTKLKTSFESQGLLHEKKPLEIG